MNQLKSSHLIANALIWAAMIIAMTLLTKSEDNSSMIVLLMIAGWMATQNIIQQARGDNQSSLSQELSCIKKRIQGKP